MKKRSGTSRNPKQRRTSRATFPLISDEMKEWSAILQSELNSWPSIRTKAMFGFLFFYRRGNVFAALPRTRGFDSPSSLVFKFNPLPRALRKRAQGDSRMHTSTKATSKGWFSFELSSENNLSDALFWLNYAYETAAQ